MHRWCVASMADAIQQGLKREEQRLLDEQAVSGLDARDEVTLHELLADSMAETGLVVPGDRNLGPIRERGSRCPFSELRTVQLEAGEGVGTGKLAVNEHWAVASGSLRLAVDGLKAELGPGDVVMMRAGTERELASPIGASLFLARE